MELPTVDHPLVEKFAFVTPRGHQLPYGVSLRSASKQTALKRSSVELEVKRRASMNFPEKSQLRS